MEISLAMRRNRRKKAAISSIIGGILLFSIIFTVGFGYFYSVTQDQKVLLAAQSQNSQLWAQKNQEGLYVTPSVGASGNLSFTVTNTGIPVVIIAYFVTDQTGAILKYVNASSSGSTSCTISTVSLPCSLNTGSVGSFSPTPPIDYKSGTLTIKIVTNRGSTFFGTYPTQELTSTSISSLVASGLGSLEMIFSSFNFYNYSVDSAPNWKVNLSSAQVAAVTPYNKPIVFSAQITNNDPYSGTIVVDAHTDLWTFLSCGSGCGTQSLLGFYVMNVASDGTVTSTSYGSFVPIQIPYGSTKTVYFGSKCDLSISSCSGYAAQSISDLTSEHDVFMIFSGTLVTVDNASLYSQNLPFSATFTADNIAGFSQTPTTCGNHTATSFTLKVTNSLWTPTNDEITKVVVNASTFNPSIIQPLPPTGWTVGVSSGIITWTSTGTYYIKPGATLSFQWNGTSPTVKAVTQEAFISNVAWNGGTILSQQTDLVA
ncbi:MAG: hypothetical protein M1368_03535, partial [Thaumarchaeota archaeon]|nr:hypothetical protein [Nitrososphaerota archaeon]